jgi:hypothetical protein
MKLMMANIAPTPQTALANVNQSARWNSRIMEKGLFFETGGSVIGGVCTDAGVVMCQSMAQIRPAAGLCFPP